MLIVGCMRRKLGTLVPLEVEILNDRGVPGGHRSARFPRFRTRQADRRKRAIWQAPRPRNALQGIEPSGGIRNVDVRLGGCRHRAQRWATTPAVVSDHHSRRAGCHLGGDLRHAAPRARRASRSGADMNSQHRPALASRMTQRWVRAYTAHLDPARRDTRRAELASDLWEHEADARRTGLGSLRMNAQMLRRLLAGIPADLSWRRQPSDPTPRARDTGPRGGSNAVVALGLSGPRAPLRHQAHTRTSSTTAVPIVSVNAATTRSGHRVELPRSSPGGRSSVTEDTPTAHWRPTEATRAPVREPPVGRAISDAVMRYLTVRRYPHRSAPRSRRLVARRSGRRAARSVTPIGALRPGA